MVWHSLVGPLQAHSLANDQQEPTSSITNQTRGIPTDKPVDFNMKAPRSSKMCNPYFLGQNDLLPVGHA